MKENTMVHCRLIMLNAQSLREEAKRYTEPEAKAIHDRLNLWADRLEDDVNNVKALISSIPDPIDRELFRMRYIKGDTWAKIECTLPYCRAQLYKRHRKQLDCWRDAGLLTK